MLIKDNSEDIIKQVKVNMSFDFNAVKPYFDNEGTDFIKPVLGVTLYKELAVYFNFILMMAWLANMFPNVFKRASGSTKKTVYWKNILGAWMEFKSEDYHKKDMQGMMEVLDSLEGINGRDGK
jgi:hypothetical protein